jgi:hypothetical protein
MLEREFWMIPIRLIVATEDKTLGGSSEEESGLRPLISSYQSTRVVPTAPSPLSGPTAKTTRRTKQRLLCLDLLIPSRAAPMSVVHNG